MRGPKPKPPQVRKETMGVCVQAQVCAVIWEIAQREDRTKSTVAARFLENHPDIRRAINAHPDIDRVVEEYQRSKQQAA